MFEPFSNPFHGDASFVDRFCYLCFMFVFLILSCLLLAALWSPAVKGLTSWLACVWCLLVFLISTLMVKKVISKMKSDKAAVPSGKVTEMIRPQGYKTWVQSQTQNKAQWLAACGHVPASSQSLRFILSLIKRNDWLLADTCPQAANHCALFWVWEWNINNVYFENMVSQIYPSELQLNKANASDTEAAFLDLHLSISNGIVST